MTTVLSLVLGLVAVMPRPLSAQEDGSMFLPVRLEFSSGVELLSNPIQPPQESGDAPPLRSEVMNNWSVRGRPYLSLSVEALDWLLFDGEMTARSGGTEWDISTLDLYGAAVSLNVGYKAFWIQTRLEYGEELISNADDIQYDAVSARIGVDLPWLEDRGDTFSVFAGYLRTSLDIDLKEGGLPLPGEFTPSSGFDIGVRYSFNTLQVWRSVTLSVVAELAYRHMKFEFEGDPGVSDETLDGHGALLSLGAQLGF